MTPDDKCVYLDHDEWVKVQARIAELEALCEQSDRHKFEWIRKAFVAKERITSLEVMLERFLASQGPYWVESPLVNEARVLLKAGK